MIDWVQSLPGACQPSPLLNASIEADHERPEHGARQVADPAEHGRGERDQPDAEPCVKRMFVT